ncbi:hypothetical protein AMS68_004811 [Peltaster fructicola]|uniref:SMP-LTD domain-containing protein n=1 Tax=Peltaster fructicola TaxID=286661 RepID=A0A6H0XX39_9PEZI|nr:hypothetical protein AMS68_004811 [Peltaster fructicola]
MSFRALLLAYIFGGLTFLPLLLVSILAVLWYSSPIVDEGSRDTSVTTDAQIKAKEAAELAAQNSKSPTDGAASATFAVLRRYDFQGATAAFKEASNLAAQVEATGESKGSESISVYQSMYRSVFDRNKNAANPLQEGETAQQNVNAKARARGKVFYIVLRHGHLMLYDSQVQLEVRHVISLAHYAVSLQDDLTTDSAEIMDADLFTKRTAIVLTPIPDKQLDGMSSSRKPFYLFCDVNIEKEDFYHALLTSLVDPPIPKAIDPEFAIKLQSALHSSSLSQETRALNALLGRVFLGTHQTPFLEAFVRSKIEKKMARIQKPGFIASIACHSLSLGDAAPIISNVRLKEFSITGETVLALDMKYSGGVNLTIAATAKLDLGQRFKTRMVSLLLAVVLQRIQGKMLVKIKPPPSNRVWFCFDSMPEMELKIEPVVSSRQITYAFVLRAIEARVREAFAEGMVKPNWDDVPFFATAAQKWRGGIWESEGQEVEQEKGLGEASAADNPLSAHNGKTMSSPDLATSASGAELNEAPSELLQRRPTASLTTLNSNADSDPGSARSAAEKAWNQTSPTARAPKSVRAPSFAAPKALVAVDDHSADAIRSGDPPPRRRWIGRSGGQMQTLKRDAAEVVRQVRDRDTLVRKDGTPDADDAEKDDASLNLPSDAELESPRRASEPGAEGVSAPKRTMTGFGSMATDAVPRLGGRRDHARQESQDSGVQRKTILASTAAATNAARQWTWNAVANRANRQQLWNRGGPQRQGSMASTESGLSQTPPKEVAQAEPIGRGQPLPPPGMPLPGPAPKGLWGSAAAGLGSMRRKPAPRLPARRPEHHVTTTPSQDDLSMKDSASSAGHSIDETDIEPDAEGEFGPWMANDDDVQETNIANGQGEEERPDSHADIVHAPEPATTLPQKKPAPPLPPRRRAVADDAKTKAIHDSVPQLVLRDDENVVQNVQHDQSPASATVASVSAHDETAPQDEVQSPTPPDLIDLDDGSGSEEATHEHVLSEADLAQLDDDIQAIPAPVDAQAEETGVLDIEEDNAAVPADDQGVEVPDVTLRSDRSDTKT